MKNPSVTSQHTARKHSGTSTFHISILFLLLAKVLIQNEVIADDKASYDNVMAIFARSCLGCHGANKQEGSLRLDLPSSMKRGGDSGPIIDKNNPAGSEILRRITSVDDDRMPPDAEKLAPAEIALITDWIKSGLPGLPENDGVSTKDNRLQHWAWNAITTPEIPAAINPSAEIAENNILNPIDSFVARRLASTNLSPSPLAPLPERIRRLSFDLRGIPPSIEELERLTEIPDQQQAYQIAVDQFLADPSYGQRWARHWLDIAHYADTHGFERDQRRANAWRYRDYVIDSFNTDRPYNNFLEQQIAGDIRNPTNQQAVIATGFLAAGPYDFVGQEETRNDTLRRAARADDLDDMVTQVMTSTCAITIHCARCHDHKLDPITQDEYYSMWAVFAALKRGDRPVFPSALEQHETQKRQIREEIASLQARLAGVQGGGLNLADVVGGGNGFGTGKSGLGIDPLTGATIEQRRGFLEGIALNEFRTSSVNGIDGVLIPNGKTVGANNQIAISSTGVRIAVPETSGQCWDAIRNGPVNSQHSTVLDGVDYATNHSLLGLHANVIITFDLNELRQTSQKTFSIFRASVGYFGETKSKGATIEVFVDGQSQKQLLSIGRADGIQPLEITLTDKDRFLTLAATDAGNGISHDQVCFVNPTLVIKEQTSQDIASQKKRELEIADIQALIHNKEQELKHLADPERFYGVNPQEIPVIQRLRRGNPEDPMYAVKPGTISCTTLTSSFGSNELTDGERRVALANWLTDKDNPLVARVIVNRLWHHHFGRGIVATPSDFGLGGDLPTHPELLDWLARELISHDWSLKHIQKLICLSHTYQQTSKQRKTAEEIDSVNKLLWRKSPSRLDAESFRDAVLAVSGNLDRRFGGPGYEDFEYQEEYAPVYKYIPANHPDLWRRSIYRFIVRTTTHKFLATLDCPNAANLTPVRDRTITPLQALALLNNDFMRNQAKLFAQRLTLEAGGATEKQIQLAYQLCYSRNPTDYELELSSNLIKNHNLEAFCLALFNTNEFLFVD